MRRRVVAGPRVVGLGLDHLLVLPRQHKHHDRLCRGAAARGPRRGGSDGAGTGELGAAAGHWQRGEPVQELERECYNMCRVIKKIDDRGGNRSPGR